MTWEIIGHNWAVELLCQSLATGRMAHAYLFAGPPQIGKTSLALALAQALNCAQPAPPCGTCISCRKIANHVHPDVRLIVGEGVGKSIKIDQVRALQREAVLAPYEGRRRVFILCQMDQATIEAANSLLKTLEEPPAHVVLILTAVHTEALPATVVSRCQCLDLRSAALPVVEAAILAQGLSPSKAHLLARLSGGRVGWALRASTDDTLLRQRQEAYEQLVELLAANRVKRLDFAHRTSRDPAAASRLIEQWTCWWRDLLLLCNGIEHDVVNIDRLDELRASAECSNARQAWAVLSALQETEVQLKNNVNTRLALEGLLLKLPHWCAMPSGQT
jgi:DNA polymerase-3 subunit delta'